MTPFFQLTTNNNNGEVFFSNPIPNEERYERVCMATVKYQIIHFKRPLRGYPFHKLLPFPVTINLLFGHPI